MDQAILGQGFKKSRGKKRNVYFFVLCKICFCIQRMCFTIFLRGEAQVSI